jgi:hypothetical protein
LIPAAVVCAVLDSRLQPVDVAVLIILHAPGHLDYYHDRPVKAAVIGYDARLNRRTVFKSVARLEVAGYLFRVGLAGDSGRQTRTYRLTSPPTVSARPPVRAA